MQLSDQGLDLLKQRESCRLTAYRDSVGVWTIGWGDTENVTEGMTITQEEADERLARQLVGFEQTVGDAIKVEVPQYSHDACISMSYNIGRGAFQTSTLVRRINAQDPEAWQEFNRWHIPPEITSRRNGEREQFRGTQFQARIP